MVPGCLNLVDYTVHVFYVSLSNSGNSGFKLHCGNVFNMRWFYSVFFMYCQENVIKCIFPFRSLKLEFSKHLWVITDGFSALSDHSVHSTKELGCMLYRVQKSQPLQHVTIWYVKQITMASKSCLWRYPVTPGIFASLYRARVLFPFIYWISSPVFQTHLIFMSRLQPSRITQVMYFCRIVDTVTVYMYV